MFPIRNQHTRRTEDIKTEQLEERRYNLKSLENDSVKELYRGRLNGKLRDKEFTSTNEQYEYIKECLHQAAFEALGPQEERNKQKPYWWDDEIEQDIEEKRRKHYKYLSSKKSEDKIDYKEAQATVRRKICKKKNELWEKNCQRINTYLGGSRSSESWRIIGNLRKNRRKDIISTIQPQDWEEHFKELLIEAREGFREQEHQNQYQQNVNVIGSPIRLSTEEVRKICKELRNGKAAGPGGIPGELLKYGTDKLYEHLRKLFQKCLITSEIPSDWKTSYMTTIYKKGDKSKCENYRGIAVTSSVSRVYGKLLKNRIELDYRDMEAEEQAGFRAERSTVDHIFTITQLIEKKMARNQEVHLLFVDLKQAYDSIPLVRLWQTLEKTNINIELIKAVKTLYKDQVTKIKIGKTLTPGFTVSKGLKQGCCISPTLFKIYLEAALKHWKESCRTMGVPLHDTMLYTLCFADDQVVIAQDRDDLNYMTRKLIEEYRKWGMEVNINKTAYMGIGGQQGGLQLENDQTIEQTSTYKYLGVKMSQDGTLDTEITDRNGQGRKAITLLNGIFWDKSITKENKRRIYNTIIKSIITYGSEVWALKETIEKTLRATEMDFWRRSAGISRRDRITNGRVKEIMGITHTITDDIRNKQLIWYGHVQRMPEQRLPKQIINWQPGGRRRPGRPRKSWGEGIEKEIRERELEEDLWNDREGWKREIGRRRRTL